MANNGGQIRFGVGFDVDQSGLNKIKSSLQEILNMNLGKLQLIDPTKTKEDLNQIKKSAGELQFALQNSFNQSLGTLNVSKLNQELKKIDLKTVQKDFASLGTTGVKAFNDFAAKALTTNMQLKQTSSILDKMGTTMVNTIKWGITSSIMKNFTGAVQEAFGYVKALDTSLNNIRIVTSQSQEEMARFADQANQAASALGKQTKEYTNAALTFYQQGLNDQEVRARTEAVLKASNVTGESVTNMAEYLTSVWNGFQVSTENTEDAVSKLAAVADSSASNMAELATGMSKVASTANSMGVTIDQLSAQIATVIATTRQAPESVGNAFKTIYARIADIKAGNDDAEISLGNYSGKMAALGINVLDTEGKLRDLGEVFEEIGDKWGNYSREQQMTLAQVMGGQRQYNQIVSLFDNWTKYSDMLNISLTSEGAINQKNAIYLESVEAHMKQLSAAKEDFMDSLINSDSWKGFIDGATKAIQLLADFVDGIGGGGVALTALGSTLGRVFNKQIGNEISNIVINLQNIRSNTAQLQAEQSLTAQFDNLDKSSQTYKDLLDMKTKVIELNSIATAEEKNYADKLINETYELGVQRDAWEAKVAEAKKYHDTIASTEATGFGKDLKFNKNELQQDLLGLKFDQKEVQEYTGSIQKLAQAHERYQDIVSKEEYSSKKVADAHDNLAVKYSQMTVNMDSAKEKMDAFVESERIGAEEFKKLNQAFSVYESAVAEGDMRKVRYTAEEYLRIADNTIKELMGKTTSALDILEQEAEGKLDKFNNKVKDAREVFNFSIKNIDTRKLVTGVTTLVSSVGQLASVWMSLNNVIKIFNDESSTADQKAQTLISFITMSIPMLLSALPEIKTGIITIGQAIGAVTGTAVTGIGSAMAALAPILPILLAISAAIVAIKAGVDYWNRYANAVKQAEEATENLKNKTEQLNSELSSLESAVNKYKEAKDAIDDLTKGTKEWRDAVAATREELVNLLVTYPELNSAIDRTGEGLELNEEKYNAFLEHQQGIISNTQNLQLATQIRANEANSTNDIVNVSRDLGISKEQLDAVIKEVNTTGKEILFSKDIIKDNNDITWQTQVAVSQNTEKIINLIDSVNQNSISTDNLSAVMAENRLSGNEVYEGSNYQSELIDVAQQVSSKYANEKYNEFVQTGMINLPKEEQDKLLKKAYEMYGDLLTDTRYDVWSSSFKDAEGKIVAFLPDLVKEIYQQFGAEFVEQNLDTVNKNLEKMYAPYQGNTLDALRTFKRGQRGDLTGLSENEINNLTNQLYNDTNFSTILSSKGYGDGREGLTQFRKDLDQAKADIEEAKKDLYSKAGETGDSNYIDFILGLTEDQNVSVDTIENISDTFDLAFERGIKGVDFSQLYKDIPLEKFSGLSEVLSKNISNLGADGSFEQLAKDFKEVGLSANFTSEAWQNILKDSGAWDGFLENLSDHVGSLNDVITQVASGDKMNKKELEAYQDNIQFIIDQMGDLKQLAPDLQRDINIVTDQYLQGSVQWMDALKHVREAAEMAQASLAGQKLRDAADQFSKIVERQFEGTSREEITFKANIDDKDFDEKLQNYLDASYELDVVIKADIDSDLKDMGDLRDQISQLDELSGKAKVSFSEIEGLYSDLISVEEEGAVILEDGYVQLSDTAIAEAKRRKEEQLKASEETTRGEIENQMTRIKAQIEANNAAIEAANAYKDALIRQRDIQKSSVPEEVKQKYKEQAEAAKTAYEAAANNAIEKARVEEDANNAVMQSSDDVTTAKLENDASVSNSNATMCSNVASDTAKMAQSVVDNWNAMSAAQKAYLDGTGPINAPISQAGGMSSMSVQEQTQHDVSEYAGAIAKGVFEEVDLSTIEGLNTAIDELTNQIGSYDVQNERLAGQLNAYAQSLADLNSGNYANNAGERPSAGKGGSGGGKGGGGGSKGGTSKETAPDKPDHMDPFEDSDLTGTKAMFRGIDAELEQIAARLEKIQRIQSHLLGSALVVNLNKQLKVLKEQRALYQQKLDLAKQEAAALQGQLTAMGATFGRGGALTNATDILKKQAGQVNDLIDKYNGMTKAEQDAFKENIETAKKGYNKTKELISAYEELNSLITQTKSQLDQIKEQIAQIKIERFNAVIDMRIRWQDWTSKLREFQKDLDEFQANHATITINTETGEITRNESAIENATRLAAAQRQNDVEASAARAIAQNDYRYDLNRLKTKSGRKQLSREYGIDLTRRKNRRQWRADRTAQYEQSIANIDANNANFRQQMSTAFSDTVYGAQNQAAYNQLLERQAQIREEAAAARQAAQDRKKSDIGAARTGTKSERQALGNEYDVKNIKKGSAGLINAIRESYFEAIDDINNTEVAGLQKAMDEFFEQVKLNGEEAANTLGMVTKDLFAEFDARMANVKAASEEIIKGRDIGDGKRARSFVDMETEHALDMSNRLGRMYQNSIFDENGNIRKVGSDKLTIGDIDPTTGRTIINNKQLKKAKGRIKEQGGYNEVYGKWLTEALDDAEKHAEQITNTITTLQEQITEAWNIYYEAIDRVIELQERIIENLEFMNEMYEIQYKYAQLLRKPSEELYQAQRRQAEGLSTIANQYKENAINAKKQFDELGEKNRHNEEDWNKWFKVYQDSTKAYYETELQRLDALKEAAQEYIETMIKGYEKVASLRLGLSEFSQRWEDTKQITDMYLNNIDKAFAIQQLQAKYQEAINSETDPKRQAQIRDIMEQQISLLESAEYLSQAEVDNANALYDVTVKQIALEEAQRNKSKMRLRRDSQGNYTYQYVSDANDIKKKQEDLANSLQSMNKATSDALRETYDTQIKITQDYYSRLAELQKQYAEGELTDEEFTERGNYLEADYQQKLVINSTQEGRLAEAYEKGAAITLTGLTEIAGSTDKVAEWMGLNVQETANLNKAVLDLTGNGDNSLLQVMGNKNLAELFKQADTHNNNILTSDAAGWKLLRDDILPTKLFGSATGIDLSTLATEVKQNVTDESIETRAEIDKEAEEIYSEITGNSEISLSTVQDTIDTLNTAISTQLEKANDKLQYLFNQAVIIDTNNTTAIGELGDILTTLNDAITRMEASLGSIAKQQETNTFDPTQDANAGTAIVGKNDNNKAKIKTYKYNTSELKYEETKENSKSDNAVEAAIRNKTLIEVKGGIYDYTGLRLRQIVVPDPDNPNKTITTYVKADRLKDFNIPGLASGGYTGNWVGNNGKLAILHKKEQVLNADDTQKVFDAVKIANNVASIVSTLGAAAANSILSSQFGTNLSFGQSALDQNVAISATFPNVTDHNEIEQALNNLINKASQYATPNRRQY